ncbi:HAD family hydrolase [Candidatus Nitrosocosmicus agrestis]|uniref:HAD family hydrolase n=1 Tax=Candidatus Nitrosocosmicus agrestis TaxID=2563600 RepID=UPI00122E6C0C|nr:HAD family phosphatase [Candidatus Nitrosocosmicus sp. SS]KAF0870276.1 HAD family phosphatase [Candidatus Nitrosocosmicus sp. SS]
MRAILFDMDGVLIDAMPYHAEAFKRAFKEVIDLDIDTRDIYLLEGMPGADLIKQILKKNMQYDNDEKVIKSISQRKKELFQQNEKSKPFEGVFELIQSLKLANCLKAVVSGASSHEVKTLLEKNGLIDNFDLIVTGDDLSEGKPSPQPFNKALEKFGLEAKDALVVENSPIGVDSAMKAGINYMVILNNTPLSLKDFTGLSQDEKVVSKKMFRDIKTASPTILNWCRNLNNNT